MFSKKEEFTNNIQYSVGQRIEDLTSKSYSTLNELADLFIQENKNSKWKSLNFLHSYYAIKEIAEKMSGKAVNADTDLNDLFDIKQKKEFVEALKAINISPIAFSRPPVLNKIVYLYPVVSILGTMLFSTYLIVGKDMTGWVYLSGLFGLISSWALFKVTAPTTWHFRPATLLEYAKSTYVVRYQSLSQKEFTKSQLTDFLIDGAKKVYQTTFETEQVIPEN